MTALEERPAAEGPSAAGPAPGWYDDPGRRHSLRFWNGTAWTPGVSDSAGQVAEEPLAGPASPPVRDVDERAVLPARAAVLGVVGLVAGAAVGILLGLGIHAWDPAQRVLLLLAAQGSLWAGMIGSCVLACRRYGSGSMRRDYGVRIRPADAGWGLLLALTSRLLAGLLVLGLAAASHRLTGSNLSGLTKLRADTPALVLYCLMAVLGAPVIEELFFRGLLLRSLVGRFTVWGAVPIQAVLFCLGHATPGLGLGNVSVLGATLLFGLLAGITVTWLRRLGPTMLGHAAFNLVAVIGVLLVTA
jgi:uncharacterized protein